MSRTLKICIVEGFSENDRAKLIEALELVGCVVVKKPSADCNAFINASVTKLKEAKRVVAMFPNIPMFNYCWDYYLWAHEGKYSQWYDWVGYAEFLKQSREVWTPSTAQSLRLKELLGINSFVIKTGITVYDHEVTDENFVLDPVRYYPEENRGWAEKACNELGIPIIHSEHQYTEAEFRKLVASCSFMVSHYREASTGGLTLMEGLYHGKVSLVSNSPYQGAFDYVGPFAYYFQFDDFESLQKNIKDLWERRPKISIQQAGKYIQQGFTYEVMAATIKKRILATI